MALKEISDLINPKIEQIRSAAGRLDGDRERFGDLIPEFAKGGLVPGAYGSPRLVLVHRGEVIANLGQQTPDLMNAAAKSGIPGVRGNGGGSSNSGNFYVELSLGRRCRSELFVNGAKSPEGYNVLVKQNKKGLALERGDTASF